MPRGAPDAGRRPSRRPRVHRPGRLLALLAVLAPGVSAAEERMAAPFLGPGGEIRLLVRPEFRDAPGLHADLVAFGVPDLAADPVGPLVAVPPPGPDQPPGPPVPSRLLLRGTPDAVARGREILAYLDAPRPCVQVSCLAAETRCLARAESGGSVTFDRWSGPDPADTLFRGLVSDFEPDAFLRSTLTGARPFEGTSVAFGDGAYAQVLRMLLHRGEAEFLAWPTVLVAEGESAEITSLVTLPQVLFERTNAERVLSTADEVAGIRLEVRPVVVGHDRTELDLTLWVRNAEASDAPDAVPGSLVLRARKAATHLTAPDGESLLVGGLRLRRHLAARRGLPLLQAVPILDPLASARRREVEETELLLLLRADIRVPGRSGGAFAPPAEMRRLQGRVRTRAGGGP